MVRNRIFYALVIVAALAFSMAYTSKISVVILFTVLLYPVLALIIAAAGLISVRGSFSERRIVYERGEPFELVIDLKNRSIFPCVPAEIVCTIPDAETGLITEKRIFASLSPLGQARLSIKCLHKYRGYYECRIWKIYVVDPLRIIRIGKRQNIGLPSVFVPRRLELADILYVSAGEQSFSKKKPLSHEKEDFSHVRDYREGDLMQLVHWKLTAKQDDLMIKQFDSINELRTVILCDFNIYDGECNVMLHSDTVIETAVAFAKAALDKGIHSAVETGELSRSAPIMIRDKATFEEFFELMSVLPSRPQVNDFISLIDGIDVSSASALVLITSELDPELIARARAFSQTTAVFYAYLNLSSKPLDGDFSEEGFMLLNICGAGEKALNAAAENAGG